jgi:phosphoribosyl 1,2-cyclic phosphate phosphodiesterase
MKLVYLGTGAAEGIPAVFCSCAVCAEARRRGGKDIRTRSQALLDGTILFDFPPDSYAHYLSSGFDSFDLPSIKRLFITHSHMDHFYPEELQLRRPVFVASTPVETLRIYGNRAVERELLRLQEKERAVPRNEFRYAKPFEPLEAAGYRITPLPALHDRNEECLFYAVEGGASSLLYAHDTGIFPGAVWDYFAQTKPRFNLVSLDCTCMIHRDGGNHMGIPDCVEVRERLISLGAADKTTVFALNHFSHNGGLNHAELCGAAEKEGFITAFDGMEIEVSP